MAEQNEITEKTLNTSFSNMLQATQTNKIFNKNCAWLSIELTRCILISFIFYIHKLCLSNLQTGIFKQRMLLFQSHPFYI